MFLYSFLFLSIFTNKVDCLYKQANVKSLKADLLSSSPLLKHSPFANHSDKGLMLETSALKLFIILNYPVILFHRYSTTVSLETYPLYLLIKTDDRNAFLLMIIMV